MQHYHFLLKEDTRQDIGFLMWALGIACCPNSMIIPVIYNSGEIFLQKIHKTELQALSKDRKENKRVRSKQSYKFHHR